MKKWFFLFLSVPAFLAACKKDSNSGCSYTESTKVATTTEIDSLNTYLTQHAIVANQHSSGVFYVNDSLGSGNTAALCTYMTVKYKGFLLGNTAAFDSTNNGETAVLQLGGLVVGWQKVMPLIKAGGKVTLYIPPSLAYGAAITRNGDGDVIIPANSYLKFNIELISNQ